jgi:hypothetical protein
VKQVIPYATSAVTIIQMWAAGDRRVWAWPLGIANQALWLTFIVLYSAWGLLPLMCALIVTYTRNWAKWRREQHRIEEMNRLAPGAFQKLRWPG